MQNSTFIKQNPTTRLVVTISTSLADRLKKVIPARKRSAYVEQAIIDHLAADEEADWWQRVEEFRKAYDPSKDPTNKSVVEMLREDRRSH